MKCGVRFCGGCNPGYNRREALNEIEARFKDIDFVNALVGVPHDLLLVIGGCSSCCAAYEQFDTKHEPMRMYSPEHIDLVSKQIKEKI